MPNEYEVGFGKPPAKSRFRKGVSGNPRGKPKGSLNSKTILARAFGEPVVVNQNGKRKKITKREAAYKQLINKGVSGDLRALIEVIKLDRSEPEPTNDSVEAPLSESDQTIIEGILERIKQCTTPKE
jgi:uncharacterized protein DUF5681